MDAAERKLEPVQPSGPEVADATLPLERLSRADVSFAGGKGANLGELTAAGLRVPPGFVIGAPAYASFRERIGLLEETIVAAYRRLGDEGEIAVAIRSSAVSEDDKSGLNETFLNVRGEAEVIEGVRSCWASQADMDIAVVVQRQVDALRAGVMSTIDPSSGATDRLVIEGSFGLGESVVSGSVAPDRYVVDKATLELAAREIRSKELMIKPRAGGGTITRRLPPAQVKLPVLGREEARLIAELGKRIEAHLGAPQDVEWAIDARERVWVLQARSISRFASKVRQS
jgi:pyruvate, water dikinase